MQILKCLYYDLSKRDSQQSVLLQVQTERQSLGVLGIYCVYSKIEEFLY